MVGFLKFLKRDKEQDLDSLDLPPQPPKLDGFDDNLPDVPDFPEMGAHPDKDFKFDFPEDKEMDFEKEFGIDSQRDNKMPEFPDFPAEEKTPVMPAQMPALAPAKSIMPPQEDDSGEEEEPQQAQSSYEPDYEMPRRLFHHEKRALSRPIRKEVYVRVERFKIGLDGISMIRNSLRKSDEALLKLESIKNAKDRSFDKVKSSLEDLQKKLIFIDKTLFKGE